MNGGHKQVKLHGLLLTFIDSLEDAIDYPKRGHKKRKRPQRGARSSGSVAHTDTELSTPAGESTSLAHLSPPTSQNGALGLSLDNLIDLNSPLCGQNINGLMATLSIN